MIEADDIYLVKATESLAGAESEFVNSRYNNCANRSYYACFQAAIHALVVNQVTAPAVDAVWNHGWVQGQFNGLLIKRQHRYSPDLRRVLSANYDLRSDADYTTKV